MARKSRTQFAILGILSRGPESGYGIIKDLRDSVDNFWQESHGQIYPILHKLEQRELITGQEELTGKRSRKIYQITPAGHQHLEQWLQEPCEPPSKRIEILLKLFFGRHNDPEANKEHVLQKRKNMIAAKNHCEEMIALLQEKRPTDPDLPYWLITLRSGCIHASASIAWCDETLQTLEELEKKHD